MPNSCISSAYVRDITQLPAIDALLDDLEDCEMERKGLLWLSKTFERKISLQQRQQLHSFFQGGAGSVREWVDWGLYEPRYDRRWKENRPVLDLGIRASRFLLDGGWWNIMLMSTCAVNEI